MAFSCNGCGKRYPGCHSTCVDYAIDKAFHEADRTSSQKEKAVNDGITSQRAKAVAKAVKASKNDKRWLYEQ